MKKLVQNVYWFYLSDKKQYTPYTSTVLTFVGIAFMIFIIIILIFDIPIDSVFPFHSNNKILRKWVNGSIYPTIFIICFLIFYSKRSLEKEEFSKLYLSRTKKLIVVIFAIVFIILFTLLYGLIPKS